MQWQIAWVEEFEYFFSFKDGMVAESCNYLVQRFAFVCEGDFSTVAASFSHGCVFCVVALIYRCLYGGCSAFDDKLSDAFGRERNGGL